MTLLHLDAFFIAAALFCAVVVIVDTLRRGSSSPNFSQEVSQVKTLNLMKKVKGKSSWSIGKKESFD